MENNILQNIIQDTYNRYIPDDAKLIERNGHVFLAHWKNRYDPITLAIIAVGVGTAIQVKGTLEQGKQANKIAKQRAAVDEANAEAVRKRSVEEARVKAEKGRRLTASQKSAAAASGIRINVGSPLVIEAETKDIISKDIGFILESGRAESEAFRQSATIELALGKQAKRKSRFDALTQGLFGFAKIAGAGAGSSSGSSFNFNPQGAGPSGITSISGTTRNF